MADRQQADKVRTDVVRATDAAASSADRADGGSAVPPLSCGESPDTLSVAADGTEVSGCEPPSGSRTGRLSWRTKFALGVGESVQGINIMISGYYLNSFLLETACIDPILVGAMQAIQGTFDAVNDPLIGILSDRTRTRWGRRRPWLLFAAPFLAVFYFLLWNALPPSVPQFAKFLWAVGNYMGVSWTVSSIQVQIGALVPELTDDYDERTNVSAWRLGFANLFGLAGVFAHNQMILLEPGGNPREGFRVSALIFGAVLWAFSWVAFVGVKERFDHREESPKKMGVFKELCEVMRNKSFLCVAGAYFCGPTAVVLVQTNLLMFCKYIIGDAHLITSIILAVQGMGLLCMPMWVVASKHLDKRVVYLIGGTILLLTMGGVYYVESQAAALVLSFFCGSCLAIPYLIPYSMLPDVIEEDELRTGKRREGIFVGFFTIMLKMATTGALTITNFMLSFVGYQAPSSTCKWNGEEADLELVEDTRQPEIVLHFIRSLVSVVPASFLLAAIFCAWSFPITRSKQAAMAKMAAEARLERSAQKHKVPMEFTTELSIQEQLGEEETAVVCPCSVAPEEGCWNSRSTVELTHLSDGPDGVSSDVEQETMGQ